MLTTVDLCRNLQVRNGQGAGYEDCSVRAGEETTLRGFITEAQNDAKDFVKETEEKLRRWTDMLAKGQITKLEFTALVDSQKGLANLDLLTHAGIAAATL